MNYWPGDPVDLSTVDAPLSKAMKVFYVGLGLYLISFLLPALSMGGEANKMPGWDCAWLSLWVWASAGQLTVEAARIGLRLTAFGALINLATISYAVFRIRNLVPGLRFALALVIVFSVPPMWLSLLLSGLTPCVGYAIWLIGFLLMISSDLRAGWQRIQQKRDLEPFTTLSLQSSRNRD